MQYRCRNKDCKVLMDGNHPLLLASLSLWMRNAYPVDPQYIIPGKQWHLHRDFTDVMGNLMVTYGNGDVLAREIFR